jgi:hypothetical protein
MIPSTERWAPPYTQTIPSSSVNYTEMKPRRIRLSAIFLMPSGTTSLPTGFANFNEFQDSRHPIRISESFLISLRRRAFPFFLGARRFLFSQITHHRKANKQDSKRKTPRRTQKSHLFLSFYASLKRTFNAHPVPVDTKTHSYFGHISRGVLLRVRQTAAPASSSAQQITVLRTLSQKEDQGLSPRCTSLETLRIRSDTTGGCGDISLGICGQGLQARRSTFARRVV